MPPLPTVLIIAGTRPECIKLVPVIRALTARGALRVRVVNSGQHRDGVRDVLATFGLRADVELDGLAPGASLRAHSDRLRGRLRSLIDEVLPAWVVVQGDTLTAYAAARAGSESGCRVAHVEAGLRTESVRDPFPEEWFRRRIARLAHLHFAPSASAVDNLLREGIEPGSIHRTGNTAIDSLRDLMGNWAVEPGTVAQPRDTVLVTLHRRENWGGSVDAICDALLDIAARRPALRFVFPVHPNPRVAPRIRDRLEGRRGFRLVPPMSYRAFVRAAADAALIISDSGGVQEEAPHLGTPVLVPRANTERPEAVATGFVRLIAADRDVLVAAALTALAAPRRPGLPFDDAAPFGAGDSGPRIAAILETGVDESLQSPAVVSALSAQPASIAA
jgi:UDP-N-acetylglucosamine 2-epimerase (non-hydrolysing)